MEIAHNRRIFRLDTKPRGPAIFALFAILAVVHTWPLASAPARLSRNDNADAVLNEWTVSWVAHQLPRNPFHLFDANIFYPERNTLAYSESLIVPAVVGAPLRAAGASPVLVCNILILTGLTLTGWAGYLLVSRWTGDHTAGVIGGTIFAFNAHTLTRLPHLQALHVEFLPLALLAFDSLLEERSDGQARPLRASLWLALWVVLQGLTSYYALVFTTTALAGGWLARVEDWRDGRWRRGVPRVALAAAVALVAMAPVLLPYARLGQVRPLDEVAMYSAAPRDYLATPARLHYDTWASSFFGGTTALFPGVTPLMLSAIALVSGVAVRDRRARMALVFGAAGAALSFGPAMPGYAALYRLALPLQGIRNAARFGYLAIVAAAILAGFGVAWIRRRWAGAQWMPAAVAALFICANLDAFSAPIAYTDAEPVSPLHARLAGTNAIVAEFPLYPVERVFRNAPYLLHSTLHWRPMPNGYSGLTPASYAKRARDLARFPDERALATLRALGVTHVFVHDRALRDWTDNETADAVPHAPGLTLVDRDGDLSLYAVR